MIGSFPPPGAGDFFETLAAMADSAPPAEADAFGDDLEFLSDVFLDFDGFGGVDLFVDPPSVVDPPAVLPDAPVELVPSQEMDDIERFLMMDEGGGGGAGGGGGEDERVLADDFFADVLFAGSDEGSVRSGVSNGDAATPEEGEEEGDAEPEANTVAPVVEIEKGAEDDESEGKGGEDEDLLSKKRRRQMRNRDSAMKSRERKKLYVRDLEVKSKFLESECRRLQNALHCCAAENIALRQCLEKAKALGAPLAKQESAVLFVESLLLGSLFCLASIVCLFLTPSLPNEDPEKASGVARRSPRRITRRSVLGRSEGLEGGPGLGSQFVYWRRRCKALRRKMRICSFLLPLHMVFG